MKFLKDNILSFVILAAMLALSFHYYDKLPDQIPTQFDSQGNPSKYSSKNFAVLLAPTLFLILIFGISSLVKLSPQKFSMEKSEHALYRSIFSLGLLLSGVHVGTMVSPAGGSQFAFHFAIGMGFFMVVLGDILSKAERNFFVGVRTPWTLASEVNWGATHRFAGKLLVIFGVALLLSQLVKSEMWMPIVAILIPVFISYIYSFWFYSRFERATAKR